MTFGTVRAVCGRTHGEPLAQEQQQTMKRRGHLHEDVISFEALLRAAAEARRGKRFRRAVPSFRFS